ncbi:MAG TPA: hypothetical protein VFO76_01410 [Candidatus Kapabacteria bacterium]|nr:hypothetical protein [Candidatus Kapabacteria bacterium]
MTKRTQVSYDAIADCILCGEKDRPFTSARQPNGGPAYTYYNCPRCGKYYLRFELQEKLTSGGFKKIIPLLRIRTRNKSVKDTEGNGYEIDERDLNIESYANISTDLFDAIDRLLLWLSENQEYHGQWIRVNPLWNYPLLGARSETELYYWLKSAEELGLISNSQWDFTLKPSGWDRINEIRKNSKFSNNVFIAKSFDPSLDDIWENGIHSAVLETGYSPIYLKGDNEFGLIDNKIISGIRRSRFLIADYTLDRRGVYFEAGFAMGMGLKVIECCRKSDKGLLHFDKEHYTMLYWESAEDLRDQLVAAIQAWIV